MWEDSTGESQNTPAEEPIIAIKEGKQGINWEIFGTRAQ